MTNKQINKERQQDRQNKQRTNERNTYIKKQGKQDITNERKK